MKANSGGHGLKRLEPLGMTPTGYDVQSIKDDARQSIIYIAPLHEDIDTSPLTINDITEGIYMFYEKLFDGNYCIEWGLLL